MQRVVIYTVTILMVLLVCTGTIRSESGTPQDTENQIPHAVSSEKLQDIMHRLNQLTYEKELTPMEISDLRAQHIQRLVETAKDLVSAAEELTDAIPGLSMSFDEQLVFRDMASQLQNEAYNVWYLAEENDFTGMELAYQRMNNTCVACHQLFRF